MNKILILLKERKNIFIAIAGISLVVGLVFSFWTFAKPDSNPVIMADKIEVFKKAKKLILYHQGLTYEYDIATGKNPGNKQKIGDLATPLGKFKIVAVEDSQKWAFDFEDDDQGPITGAYGPWFLRFDGPWQGIAIHGTHDDLTIGKNDTHGCIRMRNAELEELKNMVTLNYEVEIFD